MSLLTANKIQIETIKKREQHIESLKEKIASLQEQLEIELDYLEAYKKVVPQVIPLEDSK